MKTPVLESLSNRVVKYRTANVMKKQILLSVNFRIQEKEKQKIHFTNADTSKERICARL